MIFYNLINIENKNIKINRVRKEKHDMLNRDPLNEPKNSYLTPILMIIGVGAGLFFLIWLLRYFMITYGPIIIPIIPQ